MNIQLIPQKASNLPPFGHFPHFFLILRRTLKGFHKWDVG